MSALPSIHALEKHFLFRIRQVRLSTEQDDCSNNIAHRTPVDEDWMSKIISKRKETYNVCLLICKLLLNTKLNKNLVNMSIDKFNTKAYELIELMSEAVNDEDGLDEQSYLLMCNQIKTDKDLLEQIYLVI